MEVAQMQLNALGIKAEMLADDTWYFTVSGIPIILQPGEPISPEDSEPIGIIDGSFYHVSEVASGIDPFILDLAVEDSGYRGASLLRYLKEKNQVGFFWIRTLLDPSAPEENLAGGIHEIVECWNGVQERYKTMAKMVQLASGEPIDVPEKILLPIKEQFQACKDFHQWGPKISTGDIEQTLDTMGFDHETVDLMDEDLHRRPILFWSGEKMFLIQDEGGRPVLYAKQLINPYWKETYFPVLRTLSMQYSRIECHISGNVCTAKMRLPEDTDYENLEKRLWICTARITQFLHELIDQVADAPKVEYAPEQMKQYLVYEVIRESLGE